ncbi:hypothetical protein TSA6c_17415 [Azospirillum sp. TSA6c]|uniref:phage capsid protein n=1 Tax=Azospirillum sp. TSA6c TaxID=709813 RepID=UPI000D614F26|nr:phage capsid protein [Azospirillum sp. TSA6c]PWC48200.1 hypothetical protein TSA6c_17415 [Azospirillum sp. TSA6c]
MIEDFPQSFVSQFQREIHEAYRRMGSKLRHTVSAKDNVTTPATNFRDGTVTCGIGETWAGDWVDRLDELKTNVDERGIIANAGAYALGRKTDEQIVVALNASRNFAGLPDDGLNEGKALHALEMLKAAGIPDDGQRHAVVGWKQWSQLLKIDDFANADYVGTDELPWRGTQAKRWLGTLWLPHSGLTLLSGNIRLCHWYHRTAVGHAIGDAVSTDITWHDDRGAHFINNMMKQGAVLVDPAGVVTMRCLEA